MVPYLIAACSSLRWMLRSARRSRPCVCEMSEMSSVGMPGANRCISLTTRRMPRRCAGVSAFKAASSDGPSGVAAFERERETFDARRKLSSKDCFDTLGLSFFFFVSQRVGETATDWHRLHAGATSLAHLHAGARTANDERRGRHPGRMWP